MPQIMGIDTEKVDEAFVNKYLAQYGLATGGKINRKIRILGKHITDMKAEMEATVFDGCTCTTCGGESPGVLSECPFCGDSDTLDPPAGTTAETTGEASAEAPPSEPEPPAEEPPEAPEPPPEEPKQAATKLNGKTPAKKRSSVKNGATKKKASARKSKATKAEDTKDKPIRAEVVDEGVVEGRTTADPTVLVTATAPTVLAKYKEGDLNRSVAKCYGYMTKATLECWKLGVELNHLHGTNMYLLAKYDDGKPKWVNFKVFVKDEFGFSSKQAYNYMAVAEHFTEEQVREVGATKLLVALKVPEDVRQQILKAASDGDTMATLSAQANALLEKNAPAKPPPVGKQLTAIIAMGLMEEPMFKAPTVPGKVGKKTKPATAINDEPFAVFQLENGVEATFQVLKNAKGDLVASLAFRRGGS